MSNVLRVAIVGSGPAGMYALEHLLEERGLEVEVDLYERLPSPYGLVRAGVAPDHPEKKLVADRLFSYFLARSNVRFFGNVEVGKDIRHQELADWYDAVIYAVGAVVIRRWAFLEKSWRGVGQAGNLWPGITATPISSIWNLTSPIELLGNDKLEKVLVVRNHLERDDKGNLSARPTEEESLIDTGQLFRAVGYRGHPFPGLPFDERKGVFENINGRIHQNGEAVPGSYVTGWIKRGPKGVIGTNKRCADETVACLLEDYHAGRLTRSLDGKAVYQEVRSRVSSLVELNDWLKVDREEKSRGKAFGRQRVKITNTAEMLRVAQLTTLNKGY